MVPTASKKTGNFQTGNQEPQPQIDQDARENDNNRGHPFLTALGAATGGRRFAFLCQTTRAGEKRTGRIPPRAGWGALGIDALRGK